MTEDFKTEFNSNVATLKRIDEALKRVSDSSVAEDLKAWFSYLQIIKREAIVKMNEKQVEIIKTKFDSLDRLIYLLFKSGQTTKKTDLRRQIVNLLDETEIYLRTIMNDKGMLLRDTDPNLTGL